MLLVGLTALTGIFLTNKNKFPQPDSSPTSNIYPKELNSFQTQLDHKNQEYDIVFDKKSNEYLITVLGSDFGISRLSAEQALLKVTGFSTSQACQQKVTLATPPFINPAESKTTYQLSFCVITSPSPGLPVISPSLSPLTIKGASLPSGEAQMAETTNSIFITFAADIDPSTVIVQLSPEGSITTKVHSQTPNELIITPNQMWKENTTYTVNVKAGLLSKDGLYQLKQDAIYTYQVKKISSPPPYPPGGI